MAGMLDEIYRFPVPLTALMDCDPARQNIYNGGGSGNLKYMAKHPGTKVSFLKDMVEHCDEIHINRVDTKENTAPINLQFQRGITL